MLHLVLASHGRAFSFPVVFAPMRVVIAPPENGVRINESKAVGLIIGLKSFPQEINSSGM